MMHWTRCAKQPVFTLHNQTTQVYSHAVRSSTSVIVYGSQKKTEASHKLACNDANICAKRKKKQFVMAVVWHSLCRCFAGINDYFSVHECWTATSSVNIYLMTVVYSLPFHTLLHFIFYSTLYSSHILTRGAGATPTGRMTAGPVLTYTLYILNVHSIFFWLVQI